ncbi:PAS-domain containing protein [Rubrivivax albus]|uniref:Diguanylate cyclase n=1 Tax=Rubrivivax albus TaxID=2499835 RepID=A0A3S2WVA3_9BURK|nr:GGDEF domain-containing protein [Rubrivivax albus]RVT52131.1 diguanylate cyclase [Rubrivivax albus]
MEALALLRPVCDTLDSLGVAACVLDEHDRTLTWNRSFLRFFPEHGGHIYSGEPYEANLRRFFEARTPGLPMAQLAQRVTDALARHRAQHRALAFDHRGRRLRVGSLPLPGIGRIRIWTEHAMPVLGGPVDPGRTELGLFDHLPDAVMVTTEDGLIAWVNETFVHAYGLPDREAAVGQRFEVLYAEVWSDKPDRHRYREGSAALVDRLRHIGAPFELPLPMDRWVRIVGQAGPEGRGIYAHVDITELKRNERRLMEAEQRTKASEAALQHKSTLLEAMLARMEQGVMMVNADHVVEVCNPRAIELLGLPPDLMASHPRFQDVLEYQWSTDEFRDTSEDLKAFVRAGGILDIPQIYDRARPDGRIIEVRSVPLEGGGVLRTYTDVSDRRRREDSIRQLAQRDDLTDLLNRASFRERLAGLLPVTAEDGFALHFIDLDHFKPVNDRHGHVVGDRVLAALADRLRGLARDGDTVARLGGDEFAVLQMGVRRADHALGLAHRIVSMLSQPLVVDRIMVQVGASVGVALAPHAGGDVETLIRHADDAMYAAKASRRGTVRIHGHDGAAAVPAAGDQP